MAHPISDRYVPSRKIACDRIARAVDIGTDVNHVPQTLCHFSDVIGVRQGRIRSNPDAPYPLFDHAVRNLNLDWLEDRLSRSRFLLGDEPLEYDWRLRYASAQPLAGAGTIEKDDPGLGTGPMKRGDLGRRRTAGWIEHGDGNGGEPARSPSGRLEDSPAGHSRDSGHVIRGRTGTVSGTPKFISRPSRVQVHCGNPFRGGGSFDLRLQHRLPVEARLHMRPHRHCNSSDGLGIEGHEFASRIGLSAALFIARPS